MASMWFDLKIRYKHLQIIKHALQHYLKREGATQKDLQDEQVLLNKVESRINGIKERYGIR